MTYVLIRKILEIANGNSKIELNVVKGKNGLPEYDLRVWENNNPQEGFSMSEEVFQRFSIALFDAVNYDDKPSHHISGRTQVTNEITRRVNKYGDVPISFMGGLSNRAKRCLLDNSIDTIGKLNELVKNFDLMNLEGIGEGTKKNEHKMEKKQDPSTYEINQPKRVKMKPF